MFFTAKQRARLDLLERLVAELLAKKDPAAVAAQIDDLRGALDLVRASTRKELGSLWGRLGGKPAKWDEMVPRTGVIEAVTTNGSDFEALLDLQQRPPAGPR
jgi:hypothetical protein